MDNDSTSDLAVAEKAKEDEVNEVEGGFGSDITLANGVTVSISEPAEWKPKDAAALGVEGRPQVFTVKFTNNGSADFDISYFAIIESTFASDLSSACVDVFELDSGIKGLPDDTVVKSGQSTEFQWAIVCPAPKDDELTLTFSLSESDVVTLKSTVK